MKLRLWVLLVPVLLYALGAICNVSAITANHGAMPVVIPITWRDDDGIPGPGDTIDERHVAWYPGARLKVLCDWIQLPGEVASIGDLCLWTADDLARPAVIVWFTLLLSERKKW
jgi:hypothetical protein